MTAAEKNHKILKAIFEHRSRRIEIRANGNLCCHRFHPAGTYKSRFCRKPASGSDEYGVTFCKQHLTEKL